LKDTGELIELEKKEEFFQVVSSFIGRHHFLTPLLRPGQSQSQLPGSPSQTSAVEGTTIGMLVVLSTLLEATSEHLGGYITLPSKVAAASPFG
jgi:hypothetical protein